MEYRDEYQRKAFNNEEIKTKDSKIIILKDFISQLKSNIISIHESAKLGQDKQGNSYANVKTLLNKILDIINQDNEQIKYELAKITQSAKLYAVGQEIEIFNYDKHIFNANDQHYHLIERYTYTIMRFLFLLPAFDSNIFLTYIKHNVLDKYFTNGNFCSNILNRAVCDSKFKLKLYENNINNKMFYMQEIAKMRFEYIKNTPVKFSYYHIIDNYKLYLYYIFDNLRPNLPKSLAFFEYYEFLLSCKNALDFCNQKVLNSLESEISSEQKNRFNYLIKIETDCLINSKKFKFSLSASSYFKESKTKINSLIEKARMSNEKITSLQYYRKAFQLAFDKNIGIEYIKCLILYKKYAEANSLIDYLLYVHNNDYQLLFLNSLISLKLFRYEDVITSLEYSKLNFYNKSSCLDDDLIHINSKKPTGNFNNQDNDYCNYLNIKDTAHYSELIISRITEGFLQPDSIINDNSFDKIIHVTQKLLSEYRCDKINNNIDDIGYHIREINFLISDILKLLADMSEDTTINSIVGILKMIHAIKAVLSSVENQLEIKSKFLKKYYKYKCKNALNPLYASSNINNENSLQSKSFTLDSYKDSSTILDFGEKLVLDELGKLFPYSCTNKWKPILNIINEALYFIEQPGHDKQRMLFQYYLSVFIKYYEHGVNNKVLKNIFIDIFQDDLLNVKYNKEFFKSMLDLIDENNNSLTSSYKSNYDKYHHESKNCLIS